MYRGDPGLSYFALNIDYGYLLKPPKCDVFAIYVLSKIKKNQKSFVKYW